MIVLYLILIMAFLVTISILELKNGAFQLVISIFDSFIGWEAPWGDSILVFQNRQWNFAASDGKIDIYAYNLCADTVLWVLEDLTEDGNSSIQRPCIYEDKLLFQGMRSQHCINLLSGELIWEHEYESGGFSSVPGLCADGKYFVRDGDDIFCYNIESGLLLWEINNTYQLQTEGSMGYYQGKLYFTGLIGYNYIPHIFCLNSTDGSLVWKGNLVSDGALVQNWKDGIIIDQNTGFLYATDTKGIVCIDLNTTPLNTSK
jgi:outer membrane protein assembly factor BamB